MRTQLTVILLLLTAFSAAAQFPVKTVNYYPASAPAEIHFVDGNVSTYPIMRITKDLIRVDPGNNNSIRMPLTYLESIRFGDGCTMFFDKGQFQFDKLVQPAGPAGRHQERVRRRDTGRCPQTEQRPNGSPDGP